MSRKYAVASKFRKPLSVDGLYYSHGLMCASYPRTVIALVVSVVIICSLPFFITPSGDINKPKYWRSPWLNYRIQTTAHTSKRGEEPEWIINKPSQSSGRTPSWFVGMPVAVIQQVYVNVEINCQQIEQLCDKSYYSISKLVSAQLLSRMEGAISGCQPVIHPAAASLTQRLSLHDSSPPLHLPRPPQGVLSPMLDSFKIKWEDMPLGYHSIKELIYGGFWEHEHGSVGTTQPGPSPSHASSGGDYKQLTLAMTLLLKSKGREDFEELFRCVESVKDLWPDVEEKRGSLRFMKHFYYEPEWSLLDFAPLMGVYVIVFLYISFSVGKIDLVKSKIGLGLTAFVTVVAGLTMSLGICTFFGLSISLSGSEIYPYVVIVIGLENILIIVKAVMSTPEELDVKYRIAVGLSKEGWAITRNLITLALMTSMGIIFFNYVLKEFCIIALVGLLCDTFLQLVFFPTVLSIDLRRLELSDLSPSTPIPIPDNMEKSHGHSPCPTSLQVATPLRWKSKRIDFIYFLARTRIVSRLLMFSFFVLLCALFVKTHTFHHLVSYLHSSPEATPPHHLTPEEEGAVGTRHQVPDPEVTFSTSLPTQPSNVNAYRGQDAPVDGLGSVYWMDLQSALNQSSISISRRKENGFRLKCENGEVCWRPMVTTHWPRLLNHSGLTMEGRFLTLLPPIYLDFYLGFTPTTLPTSPAPSLFMRIIYHSLIIRVCSAVVCVVLVGSYVLGLVRSSRFRHERYMRSVRLRGYNRMVCLKGHNQDVDYLCVDSGLVVTTSLDGDIRVWDANPMKRRCARVIARSELFREPPAEVSSTSHRPAAEGCEAADALTSMKHPGFSRRGSVVSHLSRSSSVSDVYDHHGNRSGARSASRLSSVSDVSSWEHLDHTHPPNTAQGGTERSGAMEDSKQFPSSHAYRDTPTPPSPMLPSVPVRRFSSHSADTGSLYTSPQAVVEQSALSSTQACSPSSLLSHQWPGPVGPGQSALACPVGHIAGTSVGPVGHPVGSTVGHTAGASLGPVGHPVGSTVGHTAGASVGPVGHAVGANRGRVPAILTLSSAQSSVQPSSLQNRPHPSPAPGPHPSITPVQHTWSDSYDSSKPHPNHTSQPFSHRLQSSLPHTHLPHPLRPSSTGQGYSVADPSCVHVQLEPEYSEPAAVTAAVAAPEYPRQQVVQSHSPIVHSHSSVTHSHSSIPSLQSESSHPGLYSYSSAYPTSVNVPVAPSNLHVSLSRDQFPSGSMPGFKVSWSSSATPPLSSATPLLPGDTTVGHMQRLGHSRHLSLGGQNGAGAGRQKRPTHTRNRSLGSIPPSSQALPLSTLHSTQGSCSNLSMMSNASICGSELSAGSNFLTPSQLCKLPDPDKGYDFAQHFNLFSQYTSNMALELCVSERGSEERLPTVPPVWCMAFWNRVVAVGCSNGQVEGWNASTGSLIFNLNIGSTGISSITMSSSGIVTGQMDGSLSLIGYNGLLYHCVPAHDKAIGVLKRYGDKIISGGYDSAVKVHCISASGNSLICVNSVYVHEGNITAVTVVECQSKLGCVSGCSRGLVIHWDINSGSCINEFGMYKSPVLQLEPTIASVVGLFGEGCVRVWDIVTGSLLHTIALDGVCHDLTVLSSQHIAVTLESSLEVYDLESGKPHLDKQLEPGSMSLVRHVQALDGGASVVCSSGRDVYIIPCDLKLKTD